MTTKSVSERSSTSSSTQARRVESPPPPKPKPAATKPMKFADGFSNGALAEAREAAGKVSLDAAEEGPGFTGSAKSGFERPKADADGLSGGYGAKVKGSGSLELAEGWGVSGGVSAVAKSAVSLGTKDGLTTFEVTAELSGKVSGALEVPVGGLEGSISKGLEGRFTVSVPEEAAKTLDLSQVDPLDPSTLPTGSSVKLEGSSFTETELGASFKALSLESGVKTAEGTSVLIEKTGDTTVRVTVGDSKTVDATTRLSVGVAGASVGLGKTDELDGGKTKTVELDLSTPEGARAYAELLGEGTLPKEGVTTTEYFSVTSSSAADLKVGDETLLEVGLGSNSGVYTRTTHPDGTITGEVDLSYEGGAALHVEQRFDPDGTERLAERTYEYTFTVTGETERGELGIALGRDLEVGQELSVKLTEAQLAELKQRGVEVGNPVAEATLDPERFAIALADASDGVLENLLFRVADPTGTASSRAELRALPLEVIIRP